jgi:hypothetical protein
MSRLLALAAVAVIAFACAPRPVPVIPAELPIEEGEPDFLDPGPEPQDPGLNGLHLDPEDEWPILLERLDHQNLKEMITADHLGPPPVPDPEEFREPKQPEFPTYRPRRNPRWRLFRENGAKPESEWGVALGLAWLARQQNQDGSWEFEQGEKGDRVAATGFVLLPYLAAGETHKPRDRSETKYQKSVAATN